MEFMRSWKFIRLAQRELKGDNLRYSSITSILITGERGTLSLITPFKTYIPQKRVLKSTIYANVILHNLS